MAQFQCNLCCQSSFESIGDLKAHIAEVLSNFKCPICNAKFDRFDEMVVHLDSNCEDAEVVEIEVYDGADEQTADANGEPEVLNLTEDDAALQEQNGVSNEDGNYFCEECEVYLDDINKHLEMFHVGQQVLVEEEAEVEADAETEAEVVEQPKSDKLETISQQNITDKEGRLYTRKFVKIDKFWLQDGEPLPEGCPKISIKHSLEEIELEKEVEEEQQESESILIHECPECHLLFPSPDKFLKHKCNETKIKCCSQTFNSMDELKEHCKTHADTNNTTTITNAASNISQSNFCCEFCNTTLPTFKSLKLHKRMHDPLKTRANTGSKQKAIETFFCSVCKKVYDKAFEQVHMESHTSSTWNLNCSVCNRKFLNRASLDMHIKAHTNNKKFACSYCKKPFITMESLNEHLVNQCQRRLYECQFCGRRFARPHEKVKHERIHTGEKPHVCEICGKSFRVSYCLTLHLRTHSGTRPYQCKHCDKRFKSLSVYNHHKLTHSDVRAYKCPFCPKAFKTSVQLAGHKNSHTKPFNCTECNRPFSTLYGVRAHMETHQKNNSLKYECWTCGAQYSRAFALKEHMKEVHGDVDVDKAQMILNEEMDAANSILVKEDEMILGLDTANIEIIEDVAHL